MKQFFCLIQSLLITAFLLVGNSPAMNGKCNNGEETTGETHEIIIYEFSDLSYGDWYKFQPGLYKIIVAYKDSLGGSLDEFRCRNHPGHISFLPYVFNQAVTEKFEFTGDTIKWNVTCDTIYNHNFTYTNGDLFLNGFIISTGSDTRYATGPGFCDMHKDWPKDFPEEEKEMFDRMRVSFDRTILNDMRKPVKDFVYPECIYNYFTRIIIKDGKVEDIQTLYSRDLKYQQADQIWKNR